MAVSDYSIAMPHAVQNAQAADGYRAFTAEKHVAQIKYDGFRLLAHVDADGEAHSWTRAGGLQDGKIPAVYADLAALLPADSIVDGEIVALQRRDDGTYDNRFQHVQAVMLSDPSVAASKSASDPLDYFVFDVTRVGGRDVGHLPYAERRQLLVSLFADTQLTRVALSPDFPATQDAHDKLVALGLEGTIVRSVSAPYAAGKRGRGVHKIKAAWDIDAIVTGFKPGGGKYEGMIGALEFSQPDPATGELVVRGFASGMSDAMRRELTDSFDGIVGKLVITVSHNGVFPDGVALRHPQWKRNRLDRRYDEIEWNDR